MNVTARKAPRGRPKTFNRSHVIGVATQAYWEKGQSQVSLNAICHRAKVSKPSLYKEFESEDGLKQAVLIDYHKRTLAPLYKMLEENQPFETGLEALTQYVLRDHQEYNMPNGCLFVDMCQCREAVGELTGSQIDHFQSLSLKTFEVWIGSAKANNQLKSTVPPRTAAIYIDAQIASIMNMQRQGVSAENMSAVFRLALSVFE